MECVDLVVQPGGEQVYFSCTPTVEEESGYPGVERPCCGVLQTLSRQSLTPRKAICLDSIATRNMACQQSNASKLTLLNDLPDFGIQALGPGASHPVQVMHDSRAVHLNQDVCVTSTSGISSWRGKQSPSQVYMETKMISDQTPLANKGPHTTAHP